MDDNGTMIEDALTKARRARRRLLVGGGITGSLMLTLPSRRLLASTTATKYHGSLWCSFCNAKQSGGAVSNTPITTNQLGDLPSTWLGYASSTNPNDGPVGWATWNFETYFPKRSGYKCLINGSMTGSYPTFQQCLSGIVTYKNGNNIVAASYAQQAACSYLNATYYSCSNISFYRGNCTANYVCQDFNSQSAPSGLGSCATKYSAYNLDS